MISLASLWEVLTLRKEQWVEFGSGERKREQVFLLWTQLEELPTAAGCGCRLTHP